MLLHYSGISSVRVIVENGTEIVEKKSSDNPQSMTCLEREFKTIRELQSRGLQLGLLPNQSDNFEVAERSIKLLRKGTHDLSDVGHDLTVGEFFEIISRLAREIHEIHENGYVHRDIKPGNIMISETKKQKKYAGIVDFGMALRINRIQQEKGVAGGTPPFGHKSQYDKNERARCGQDWYSFALTALYLMRTSVSSMQAEIDSSTNGIIIDFDSIAGSQNNTISLDDQIYHTNQLFFTQLSELIQIATSATCSMEHLEKSSKKLVETVSKVIKHRTFKKVVNKKANLPISGNRIIKHDLLLIIDETNSLASDISRIKDTIDEVVQEFDGEMDLRIDLWTVRDYARKDSNPRNHETVRRVGYRLTARSMVHAIDEIAADALQHDEAEAYEMGFEWATGNLSQKVGRPSKWLTRKQSTNSVVLAGDAYAHGWLRKNWWAGFYGECKTDEKVNELKLSFQRRHPNGLSRNDEEKNELQRRRTVEKSKTDQFGSKEEKVPDGMGGMQNRPNLRKVVEKLRQKKNCTIHTISLGGDVVSNSYMKFVALLGNGVTINGKDDFVDALIGIIASPDKLLYQKLLNRDSISQTAKQNLAPLTTFSLDG